MEDPCLWASRARKMTLTSGTSSVSLSAVDVLKVIMVKLCAEVQPLSLPCTTIPLSFHLVLHSFFNFCLPITLANLIFLTVIWNYYNKNETTERQINAFVILILVEIKIKGIEYSIYLLNPSLFTAALLKSPFFSKWFYVTGTPKSCQ